MRIASRGVLSVLLWAGLVHAWPSLVHAQRPPVADSMETTRGLALGTGLRASATSTSAIAYNPAGLAGGRLYHLETTGFYDAAHGRFGGQAAIADSLTGRLAAGISARALTGGDDSQYSGVDARLAFALPLGDAIALGVGGRYISTSREGQTPAGTTPFALANGFTFDASLRISPMPGLSIAAVGQNLLKLDSPIAPLLAGGSVSYSVGTAFTIGADVLADVTTFDRAKLLAGGGVEYLSGGRVPLRLGYFWDQGRQIHYVTGGLGYVERKVGIDFSFRQQVSGGSDTTVMASLRYFVE